MKTPEQIAAEQMDRHIDPEGTGEYGPDIETTAEAISNMIIAAIEADRAQHQTWQIWPDDSTEPELVVTCDKATAEHIADTYTAYSSAISDGAYAGTNYTARKIGA